MEEAFIPFGKYKGKCWADIVTKDYGWILYCFYKLNMDVPEDWLFTAHDVHWQEMLRQQKNLPIDGVPSRVYKRRIERVSDEEVSKRMRKTPIKGYKL